MWRRQPESESTVALLWEEYDEGGGPAGLKRGDGPELRIKIMCCKKSI
jgi:hypothetical protein